MHARTPVQGIVDWALPDDPPLSGQSRDVTNIGSLDEETTDSESRTTYEAPPPYSILPQTTLPPLYLDLFPSPSSTPSQITTSRPIQVRQSRSESFSRPPLLENSPLPAPTATPRTIGPPFEAKCHDKSISILFRLPDGLLGLVVEHLDNSGIECLRRVSRRFVALCNEEILTRPYTFQPRWKLSDSGGPFAWPRFRAFDGSHAWTHIAAGERQQFLQLIARDAYCDGCLRAQNAGDWELRVERLRRYLYCHSCKADHPACIFPWWQRQAQASNRSCIAHEGYFRLCQHEEGIIRWSDISRISEQSRDGEDEIDCVIRCQDASHAISCPQTKRGRSDIRVYRHNACCVEWPVPQLKVDGSKIKLRWGAHMPLQTDGRSVTANDLRQGIAEIRAKGGRFLYPAMTFEQDVPEMRCFDPNECDCVSREASRNVESIPRTSLDSEKECPTNFSRKLPQYPPNVSSSRPSTAGSSIREQLRPHSLKYRGACESSQKKHEARWYFFGPAQVKVAFWPCHSSDFCLVLHYTRILTIGRDGAIDAQWYQALYPESYNITGDKEGFEIYWCRQNRCRNYHGRIPGFSRIIGGKEYHRTVYSGWSVEALKYVDS
ncbi:hypothetical protein KVR01_012006 [Diaporthe batatas]|uniref:uncharacterized protein n=1 Tax=Diaporthe batatas TaxID=748121 RepID=UPI001D04BB47|nr:uncharacterized protein KVR01_012006 [Diaporthe batatas]KAG8158245.1 hypothetical protein KVR01_012006 [Diaporthe batatas]